MYTLQGEGMRGAVMAKLIWGFSAVSISVVVIIGMLVLIGSWRSLRTGVASFEGTLPPLSRGERDAMPWIYAGLIVTTITLAVLAVWTISSMVSIGRPPKEPPLTIEITGNQWWWRVRYEPQGDQSRIFVTANEIHIPVGEPVRVRLISNDVIHSFWVPALTGKTDLIPGRINETWIEADKPGVYRGQCAEYCGQQHAHMALSVFADPPDRFQAWWDGQLRPAGGRSYLQSLR
ncbi:cytochrome c oxidase subunit II [Pseudaminobacter sp. 19-2017]|uniref:Cytochrome aa3 subunit 2 n=2 Tax=Pseudaminobacter soli (ex Zhang et al. 2022) TaxID=2831468 RepID=A0A942I1X8_9HYPH|nr:cytochrome c oxidase subunit II [Pseudaminobacter soli]